MSTIDEIRMTLNGRDIEIFIERFLGALNDIDGGGDQHLDFPQVYEQMGLSALKLPPAMRLVIQDQLLPRRLIQIHNDKVRITDKGRHRCEQFKHTDELEWKETVKRIGNLDSTTRREDRIGGRHKILKSHHVESEFI
ncbi:MAG TPA: hypothetical protein VFJ51_10055 [Nitrososphaeraceae archaeon]|nr:hypothetical protein [Nitrososphaeraceae archaeon]